MQQNRKKLVRATFDPLPPGHIRPAGWLLRQLQIQTERLTGHLDKFWPDIANSGRIGGTADAWERGPYWLDGLVPLAFLGKSTHTSRIHLSGIGRHSLRYRFVKVYQSHLGEALPRQKFFDYKLIPMPCCKYPVVLKTMPRSRSLVASCNFQGLPPRFRYIQRPSPSCQKIHIEVRSLHFEHAHDVVPLHDHSHAGEIFLWSPLCQKKRARKRLLTRFAKGDRRGIENDH